MNVFGAGTRVCLGESLAKHRLFLIIAALVQRFHIKPDLSRPVVPYTSRDYIFHIVAYPPEYRARFIERG